MFVKKQYPKYLNEKHVVKAEILIKRLTFYNSAKCSAFSTGWQPYYAEYCLFMMS